MPYPIEKKLVIAVSSSALFDLAESDGIFRTQGVERYREYQMDNIDRTFDKGVAYPFVRRLLSLNDSFPKESPVEVVLFSKNSPETGLRVFRSIRSYGLNITRAHFSSGKSNFQYLPAFNASLFLSANPQDTRQAIQAGYAAGTVVGSRVEDDLADPELRLGFDFDGVLADDASEQYLENQAKGDMNLYFDHEANESDVPLSRGPIAALLQKISYFQKMEKKKQDADPAYRRMLKTAIITARNAPAHERVVTTLRDQDVEVDDVFFLGGIEKARVLKILRPHIFFDDQTGAFDLLFLSVCLLRAKNRTVGRSNDTSICFGKFLRESIFVLGARPFGQAPRTFVCRRRKRVDHCESRAGGRQGDTGRIASTTRICS